MNNENKKSGTRSEASTKAVSQDGKQIELVKLQASEDKEVDQENNMEMEDDDELNDVDKTFCQRLKLLFTNKAYILLCMSLTTLYFIITGIQYWGSDYMITELK